MSGNKLGSGTRVERHNPEVVAKTIEAKEKLAIAAEDVRVVDQAEAAKLEERAAFYAMAECGYKSAEAQQRHVEAVIRWTNALKKLEENNHE